MDGNPIDEQFRPPYPALGVEKSTVQSINIEEQESVMGELSHGIDTHTQLSGEERGVRNMDSRQEGEMVDSPKNRQEKGNRDGHQKDTSSIQSQ